MKSKLFIISMLFYTLFIIIALFQRFFNINSGIYLNRVKFEDVISFSLISFYIMFALYFGAVLGGYIGGYDFHNNTFCFSHLFEGRIKQHALKILTLLIVIIGILLITVILTIVFCLFRIADIECSLRFKSLIEQLLVTILATFELSLFSYILAIIIRRLYIAISIPILLPFLLNAIYGISKVFKYISKYWFTSVNTVLIAQVFSKISSKESYVTIKIIDSTFLHNFSTLILISAGYLITFLTIIMVVGSFISDN
ncbi:hypothetical protein Calla_1411 [Caldicellulosiruptor acetigenus 6A]|uniref:Uncharacterized protein n=2 Tax=Caldicellulosiruptor acetigenus TaxID=301953 RepID=G2PYH9_9FIRM|nr:hypothetical protein Calla_1411 [Caldicellulosiruptor acetigenus 6A]